MTRERKGNIGREKKEKESKKKGGEKEWTWINSNTPNSSQSCCNND